MLIEQMIVSLLFWHPTLPLQLQRFLTARPAKRSKSAKSPAIFSKERPRKKPEMDLLPSGQQSRSAAEGGRGRMKFHRRSPKLLSWMERVDKAPNWHMHAYLRSHVDITIIICTTASFFHPPHPQVVFLSPCAECRKDTDGCFAFNPQQS